MGYDIEGRLLEVCTCNVLCPCWVGEDPDYKTCDTTIAWGIEKGSIEGVDVSGLTIAVSAHIPKNILIPKSWKAAVFVDDRSTDEQQGVLLQLFTGQLGGPVADLAGLIGEVVAVERVPITFSVHDGKGQLTLGSIVEADMAPYRRRDRQADDPRGDGLQHDPGVPRVRLQGEQVPAGRQQPRHPERGPGGSQRAPGPLQVRRLTARTHDVHRAAPPRPAARPGDPRRIARRAGGGRLAVARRLGGLPCRALPPPRRRQRAVPARDRTLRRSAGS